jgi:hypothetical protein
VDPERAVLDYVENDDTGSRAVIAQAVLEAESLSTLSAKSIEGPVRDWLATMREPLNGRFRRAQRRFPQLEGEAVLALCRELLPAVAGGAAGGNGAPELLSATYDLILLHAGRGTLSPEGGAAGISVLLREAFPKLRPLLAARPGQLPGALSNAVENLGPHGVDFAREIVHLAGLVRAPEELLDAGIVLAWRLGDVRCRVGALEIAPRLPPRVVLAALGIPSWPDEAAAMALELLAHHGWQQPESLGPERIANRASEATQWLLATSVGNFIGFDGHFRQPPVLLKPPDARLRHRFWVRVGQETFRIDADVFGWSCRPDPGADYPLAEVPRKRLLKKSASHLQPDGTLVLGDETIRLPLMAGATSLVISEGLVAFTLPDSFRVRIATQVWRSA